MVLSLQEILAFNNGERVTWDQVFDVICCLCMTLPCSLEGSIQKRSFLGRSVKGLSSAGDISDVKDVVTDGRTVSVLINVFSSAFY